MDPKTITLDVREDLRNGHEPFSKIMSAIAKLGPREELLLIAPFEPVPLFHVLAKQGFTHTAQKAAGGEWEILFRRENAQNPAPQSKAPAPATVLKNSPTPPAEIIELDVRGLEPPQPLVAILEALGSLRDGAELRAQTDRRPMHLYAQLEQRGFTGQTEETKHGSFITLIRRG
jgi:uncharacterized protein (DUF2249 family)